MVPPPVRAPAPEDAAPAPAPGPVATLPPAAPRPPEGAGTPVPTPAPAPTGARGDGGGGSESEPAGEGGGGVPDATQQQLAQALGVPAAPAVVLRAPVLPVLDAAPQIGALPAQRQLAGLLPAAPEAPLDLGGLGGVGASLRGVAVSADELQRALRSPAFVEEMDRVREQIRAEFNLDRTVAVSAAGVGFGASVIYVLWLIRGGVLMGSYLSAMPAWRVLDPLPVLSQAGEGPDGDGDGPDDEDAFGGPAAGDPLASLRGY